MQIAGRINAADESIGPSARKKRGPQDDMANLTPVPSPVRGLEVFSAFVKAGRRLAEIHVHYEQQPEYPLTKIEKAGEELDYRVEKMKLSKDKTPSDNISRLRIPFWNKQKRARPKPCPKKIRANPRESVAKKLAGEAPAPHSHP